MGKAGSGFKKPANKKSYTKKDIIQVSVFIAAIIALIAVFAIIVSSDDFIRTKNGRLQMDDNWLIAQYATKNGSAWYQVGEVDDIEGYTLSTESAGSSIKYIYPDDVNSNVAVIYVGAAVSDYEEMHESLVTGTVSGYSMEAAPEFTALTIAGKDAVMSNCIIPESDAEEETTETSEETEEASEETAEETVIDDSLPGSMIYACIDYDDERCIFIQINTLEAVTDEEAMELIETAGAAITLTER